MPLNLTQNLALRRPTLIRVWRPTGKPGTPLTSVWVPAPDAALHSNPIEDGGRCR
jgi:hypothetical protein